MFYSRSSSGMVPVIGAVVIGTILLLGLLSISGSFKTAMVSFTVSDKERVCDTGEDRTVTCRYLVFTEEGTTYENTDSLFRGKTRSSDLQGCLKIGQRYDNVKVVGFRNGFLSSYQNIISVPACNV